MVPLPTTRYEIGVDCKLEKIVHARTRLTHVSLAVLFVGYRQNSTYPDQTTQNAASDQGLHCLLTEYSIKI